MFEMRLSGMRHRMQDLWARLMADRRWLAAGVGLLALQILSNDSGISPGVVLAAALIAFGVMLLRPEPATTVSSEAATEARALPRAPRRPRSKLWLLCFAATFVVMGVALAGGALDLWTMDLGRITALPLLVIGGALIAGAWWGRSRLLILVGLGLVPVVAVANVGPIPFPARVGDIYEMPQVPGQIQESYTTAIGSTTIDLSHLVLEGRNVTIPIEFGIGEVDILVPRRFMVTTSAQLRAGALYVFGARRLGDEVSLPRQTSFDELAPNGSVTLDIRGTAGSIAVTEVWAPPECRLTGTCRKNKKQGRERNEASDKTRGPDRKKVDEKKRDGRRRNR